MKLPIPSLLQKKNSSSVHYLALLLRDEKAVAIIIEEVQGTIKVIGRHEEALTSPLENFAYEELLTVLDKTISRAEETLPPSVETESTVFGVKESWVEDKKIKKEYLSKLKRICDELSLKPIGFMVISEAISHLIQKEEGAPLSAVLADITPTHVSLSLFRAGKILESNSAEITGSVTQTVDKLLHHFTVDVLPSRIVLLNDTPNENLAQEFIAHHFSKSIPFLHVPQISVLPNGFDGKAMVYGAADQMGLSASHIFDDLKITDLEHQEEKIHEKGSHHKKDLEDKKEETVEEKINNEIEDNDKKEMKAEETEADDFGFVLGKDVTTVKTPPYAQTQDDSPSFTINAAQSDNLTAPDFTSHSNNRNHNDDEEQSKKASPLNALVGIFSSLSRFIPRGMSFSSLPLPKGKLTIIIPAVLIGLIAVILLYILNVKANVVLTLEPKNIEREETITLALNSGNNFSERVLGAKEVEVQLEGSATINVTGKKEIGEKAKGTVTVYNQSSARKVIPAGSTLTSKNNREFVTDKEVTIASASGDIFSGIKSGTAQVAVTAKQIGSEYNLPSKTEFDFNGMSGVAARNESAFSGGSKKEVTVFSKKDADALSEDLPESLEEKAKEALREKLGSDEEALGEFTDITLTKKNFDKDINEEAKQVTLKATVLFTTLAYNTKDVKDLAQTLLKEESTDDLSLSDKDTQTELRDIEVEEDEATATLSMKGGLLPKIQNDDIISEITGKSEESAAEYLHSLPQVKTSEIQLSPNIPILPKFLPRIKKNISVTLNT